MCELSRSLDQGLENECGKVIFKIMLRNIHLVWLGLFLIPDTGLTQSVYIQFKVNMNYQQELGNFDPANDFVDVAGDFNAWGDQLMKLTDPDGDMIYSLDLAGFTVGSTIAFKFRINGQWNGLEEFPGGGPNRSYVVQAENNLVDVWYSDEVSPTGPPEAYFSAGSQTVRQNGFVYFDDNSAGDVAFWEWTFEGGTPATSTQRNPAVQYKNLGTYDVQLIVGNATEGDTLLIQDFIRVVESGSTELSWWNDAVFYELFVRSFNDSDGDGVGDFQGIIEKLDYLNDGNDFSHDDLGITGIWLMPVNPSPSYHGYDVSNYRDVEPDYGTLADFKAFLDAAHARGIRVIMDFVMNHSSSQHPWFTQSAQNVAQFRNYYRWSDQDPGYLGPWGQQVWHYSGGDYYYGLFWGGMPDLNYVNHEVQDSMFAAADYWINDVGVDGFRLDAALYIFEDGEQLSNAEETFQFWGDFNQHIKSSQPDVFTVGEVWTNTNTILNYVTNDRLDYCFEFDLASATLYAIENESATQLALQLEKSYNLYPYLQFGTFLTNHDQNRSMNALGEDVSKAKLAAGLYLTFPGIPYLYYGEEIGMTGVKPDEYIRTPMQWSDASHAGFTSGTPWIRVNSDYPTKNVALQQEDETSLLSWYQRLITVRNGLKALRRGDLIQIGSSSDSVIAYLRSYDSEQVMVVANLGSTEKKGLTLTFPEASIESGAHVLTELAGQSEIAEINITTAGELNGLHIDAYEIKIYGIDHVSLPVAQEEGVRPGQLLLSQNYPNPFNPATTIHYSLESDGQTVLVVYDMRGSEVARPVDAVQVAGSHQLVFNGRNLAAGVYFYRLIQGTKLSEARKMLLVK